MPWLLLVLILTVYLFADSDHRSLLSAAPITLLVLDGIYIYFRYRAEKNMEVVLGLLCFAAILAGFVVGSYANTNALAEYWRLGRGASYFNVLPDEQGAGRSDAATLGFAAGAAVDTSKTYGFVDGSAGQGTIYCVAPVSAGNAASIRVQYWAAGTNCCYPRSDFSCGASNNANAIGAVVLDKTKQRGEFYGKAIAGAEAAYGLQAGDEYLLVSWTEDPVSYRNNLLSHTRNFFMLFSVVYLVMSTMVGLAINSAALQH